MSRPPLRPREAKLGDGQDMSPLGAARLEPTCQNAKIPQHYEPKLCTYQYNGEDIRSYECKKQSLNTFKVRRFYS